ncbi:hypothetical protein ABPG75_005755 [Micractinium tetrahymenae]
MNLPPELQAVRRRGLGAFAAWPDELVCYFLAAAPLSTRDLLALSSASKLMRLMVCEEPLWLQRHLDRCMRPFEYRGSWRATCLAYLADSGRPGLAAADLLPPAPVPGFSSEVLYRRWYRCHVDLSTFLPGPPEPLPGSASYNCGSNGQAGVVAAAVAVAATGAAAAAPNQPVLRIADASCMGAEEFEAKFDAPRQPVLLGGLTAGWPGSLEAWQPASLAQRFGDRLFKVTKPFMTGGRTKMRLADYLAYCAQRHDEEPLYIFDSSFAEAVPELARQYAVPCVFRHDLFACLEYKREDYRWLVAGPARSGASWHVDPSATSAWNTLLSGRKRWALYPPGQVPPGVQVHIDADGHPSFQAPTSLQWYLEVFPQLPADQRPLELVQQAGDTIFVPAGWWHCVLNLDLTVAVTQNFVSPANLEAAVQWQALGAGSMFDPYLVPAYLRMRQAEAEAGQQQGGLQRKPTAGQEGPPAKRQRQERPALQAQQAQRHHASEQQQARAGADEAGGVEEDDEAAGRRAAVEHHLRELSFGFSKGGLLAPWLRQLLQQLQPGTRGEQAAQQQQQQQQPQQPSGAVLLPQEEEEQQQHERQSLGDRVWQLALQWTELPVWRPRLEAACSAAGLAPPRRRREWLPLATGTCVVFEVAGAILKFFHPEDPHSAAMAAMEAAAYCCIAQAAAGGSGRGAAGGSSRAGVGGMDGGSSCSLLLGGGVLEIPAEQDNAAVLVAESGATQGAEAAGGPAAEAALAGLPAPLPFLAVRRSPGVTVGSCSDRLTGPQWLAASAAVGRSLAAFHLLPLPAAAATGTVGACGLAGGGGRGGSSGRDDSGGRDGSRSSGSISTAWLVRDGLLYSSALGTVDLREEEVEGPAQLLQRQWLVLRGVFPQAAALLVGDETCDEQAEHTAALVPAAAAAADELAESAAAAHACGCRRCSAWQPFLSFLRRQRRHAAAAHRRDEALPPQLLEQVESYLPADPAVLLGLGSGCGCGSSCCATQQSSSGGPAEHPGPGQAGAAGSMGGASAPGTACGCDSDSRSAGSGCAGGMPVWVHGDLTAENILLSDGLLASGPPSQQQGQGQREQATAAQQQGQQEQGGAGAVLIDFADSGHGDPLFDFVPLLFRTLRWAGLHGRGRLLACLFVRLSQLPAHLPALSFAVPCFHAPACCLVPPFASQQPHPQRVPCLQVQPGSRRGLP